MLKAIKLLNDLPCDYSVSKSLKIYGQKLTVNFFLYVILTLASKNHKFLIQAKKKDDRKITIIFPILDDGYFILQFPACQRKAKRTQKDPHLLI